MLDQRGDLKLLHYRFLGLDYVLPRFEAPAHERAEQGQTLGRQYEYSREQIVASIDNFKSRMVQVVP